MFFLLSISTTTHNIIIFEWMEWPWTNIPSGSNLLVVLSDYDNTLLTFIIAYGSTMRNVRNSLMFQQCTLLSLLWRKHHISMILRNNYPANISISQLLLWHQTTLKIPWHTTVNICIFCLCESAAVHKH